jgi:hypothetical protein
MLTRALARDIAERTIATYVQVFLGLLIASGANVIDVATIQAAAIAAIPAGLAVLKGAAASLVGDPDTAALREDG